MNDPLEHGDLMTVEQFRENVQAGGFIDYDGFGHPVIVTVLSTTIIPSEVDKIPSGVTHVLWYNK